MPNNDRSNIVCLHRRINKAFLGLSSSQHCFCCQTTAASQKPAGGSTLAHTCVTSPPLKTFSPFFACFCSSLRAIHPGAAPGGSNGQNPARKKDLNTETVDFWAGATCWAARRQTLADYSSPFSPERMIFLLICNKSAYFHSCDTDEDR